MRHMVLAPPLVTMSVVMAVGTLNITIGMIVAVRMVEVAAVIGEGCGLAVTTFEYSRIVTKKAEGVIGTIPGTWRIGVGPIKRPENKVLTGTMWALGPDYGIGGRAGCIRSCFVVVAVGAQDSSGCCEAAQRDVVAVVLRD